MNEEILKNLQAENKKIASFRKRAYAFMIDDILLSIICIFVFYDNIKLINDFHGIEVFFKQSQVVYFLIFLKVFYHAFFVWQSGATLGKYFLKIKVVDMYSLQKPNLFQALNRSAFRIVSESLLYLGYVWAYNDKLTQTWHDKISKTIIIHES